MTPHPHPKCDDCNIFFKCDALPPCASHISQRSERDVMDQIKKEFPDQFEQMLHFAEFLLGELHQQGKGDAP